MSSFAIIIPCFNEEKRLDKPAISHFAQTHQDIQIIFVDDGSSDSTSRIVEDIICECGNIELVRLEKNVGKGEAVRQGLIHAAKTQTFTFIGYLDADLSTSFDEFYNMYTCASAENADFIFGSRIKKLGSIIQRSHLRHLVGRVLVTILDKRFQLGYYDTQCGAKIFKSYLLRDVLNTPFYTRWFFDIELFLRLRTLDRKYTGIEYPLKKWENKKGSKLGLASIAGISKEIFTLLRKYK
jgi:dolichyl-phosphate beta-glucosyltransferase